MLASELFFARFPFLDSRDDCPVVPAAGSQAVGLRVATRLAKEISQLCAFEVLALLDPDMTHDLSTSAQ